MTEPIIEILESFKTDYPDISYIKEVKSGKEATVHLVKSKGELLALKIYKQHAQNAERNTYMSTAHLDARTQRAIRNRTKRGKQMERGLWTDQEYRTLQKMNLMGAAVPKVYAHTGSAILMEFLGDEHKPAPRLSEIRLGALQARAALNVILRSMATLLQLELVHGDLSAYNILWYKDKPYIIDFPQVLDLKNNRSAYEKLDKDINNIQKYFSTYFRVDVESELEKLVG